MNEGRMIWQKCEVKELRGRTSPTYGGKQWALRDV